MELTAGNPASLALPPQHIPPGRLFRLLLSRPRPSWPIQYRIRGAESVQLTVRALRSIEEAEAADAAGDLPAEARISAAARHLVTRCLYTDGAPVFASAEEAGLLTDGEFLALWQHIDPALAVCSPSYQRSDLMAWDKRLQLGAWDSLPEAMILASCVDMSVGLGGVCTVERPDRYFGVPVADITDGQRMAYRAAREVVRQFNERA